MGGEDSLEEEMATHCKCSYREKSHGQRSLEGYSPWVHKGRTWLKRLSMHTLVNQIQQHSKRIIHHIQVGFILGMYEIVQQMKRNQCITYYTTLMEWTKKTYDHFQLMQKKHFTKSNTFCDKHSTTRNRRKLTQQNKRSPGGRNGNLLQYSCLKHSMDRGAWWATIHGVPKSQTWLKWLCTHKGKITSIRFQDLFLLWANVPLLVLQLAKTQVNPSSLKREND